MKDQKHVFNIYKKTNLDQKWGLRKEKREVFNQKTLFLGKNRVKSSYQASLNLVKSEGIKISFFLPKKDTIVQLLLMKLYFTP